MSPLRPPHRAGQVCMSALVFLLFFLPVFSSRIPLGHHDPATLEDRAVNSTVKPFPLRVMPLGASITVGYLSTDGNGYRSWLRQQLRYAGWEVDMVGSMRNGTMKDNQNEGHFGYMISRVAEVAKGSTHYQPNLILIHAGTNDAIENYEVSLAGSRIDALISELFAAIPNTTIILSTLIPNELDTRVVERMSTEYRYIAARRRAQGDRVVLAEMAYFIKLNQLADGVHPDDYGYKEMASVWWAAIQEAEREGMLQAPNESSSVAVMSKSAEKMLDDVPSSEDPDLPNYIAPPQPTDTGVGWSLKQRGGLRAVVGWQVLVACVAFLISSAC